jgi:hypothetical protein
MQYITQVFHLFSLFFLVIGQQPLYATTTKKAEYPTITLHYPETNEYRYPEQRIVVIITSYKNKDWYRANLDSVYSQN